ncbi:MAG: DUF3786 domain-containing protein [Deltaproteobacteria bacterium]|nr:DUF3786 domain-containing protein [Deltaproteobacteria bacterium]
MSKKSTQEEAVELAFASAQKQLRGMDPQVVAEHSGAELGTGDEGAYLEVTFLNQRYRVLLPEAEVRGESGEAPPLVRGVLILHYLIQAQGTALARRWVDFRSLPGGVVYYPVFRGRVISRLVRMFGQRPQELISAAAPLVGRPIEMADWAVEISAFPRVPVVLALWEASEEFGPEGTVMYDDALPAYLETEDAIVVCEEIFGALKNYVKNV